MLLGVLLTNKFQFVTISTQVKNYNPLQKKMDPKITVDFSMDRVSIFFLVGDERIGKSINEKKKNLELEL